MHSLVANSEAEKKRSGLNELYVFLTFFETDCLAFYDSRAVFFAADCLSAFFTALLLGETLKCVGAFAFLSLVFVM